jgi:uncharacterized damage-inducible protein DinB
MLTESLIPIFERDLNKLKDEIESYKTDEQLWIVRGEIKNSGGNLALHLIGNLNHFIGAVLGENGYVRNRDAEFSTKSGTRAEIVAMVLETIPVVSSALGKLTAESLVKDFPVQKHDETRRMDFMLLHLFGHFSYHLGQINYHRRLTA